MFRGTIAELDGRRSGKLTHRGAMHHQEIVIMKARPAPLPQLRSDSEAEAVVDMADLTEYDLSDFRPVRFEIKPKETSLNTRLRASPPGR